MVFARTWDSAYEATPPTSQAASQGASRIQELKIDIRERLDIDHKWAGDAKDGEHEKVTLEQRTAPANLTDKVIAYAKDFNSKAEFHIIDEDGNEVRLTQAGTIALLQLANKWIKAQVTPEDTITYAAAIAPDASASNAFKVTLTGNLTLNVPTGAVDSGQVITLRLIQDATGSRIITYHASLLGNTGDDLVLSTGANDEDLMTLYYDGTSWHILNLKKDFANGSL